jgi:hypothetical protein
VEAHSLVRRIPDNLQRDGGEAVSFTRLYTQEYSWYSFLLEAEFTQGHSVAEMNAITRHTRGK